MKKSFIIIISIFLLLIASQICNAQQLIESYPQLEDPSAPGSFLGLSMGMDIRDLIKYIYLFALGTVGFVALLGIMIGAVMYVTSAGNPSKAANAKEQIMSAVLGLLLLLASVLILRTINPDLVKLSLTEQPIGLSAPAEGGGEEATGCTFTEATVKPTAVDAGPEGIITITIHQRNCTISEGERYLVNGLSGLIKQVRYGFALSGMDILCKSIWDNNTQRAVSTGDTQTDWEYQITFTFNRKCSYPLEIVNCGGVTGGQYVCNLMEGEPEKFYIKLEIDRQPEYPILYFGRINISVRDYR